MPLLPLRARRRPPRKVVVPDVVGRPVSEATRALGRLGLRIDTHTRALAPPPVEGVVVAQSVAAGRRVRRDRRIALELMFPPPWPDGARSRERA
jgi:beta-lactam-binding protein with PASTA domain